MQQKTKMKKSDMQSLATRADFKELATYIVGKFRTVSKDTSNNVKSLFTPVRRTLNQIIDIVKEVSVKVRVLEKDVTKMEQEIANLKVDKESLSRRLERLEKFQRMN